MPVKPTGAYARTVAGDPDPGVFFSLSKSILLLLILLLAGPSWFVGLK